MAKKNSRNHQVKYNIIGQTKENLTKSGNPIAEGPVTFSKQHFKYSNLFNLNGEKVFGWQRKCGNCD